MQGYRLFFGHLRVDLSVLAVCFPPFSNSWQTTQPASLPSASRLLHLKATPLSGLASSSGASLSVRLPARKTLPYISQAERLRGACYLFQAIMAEQNPPPPRIEQAPSEVRFGAKASRIGRLNERHRTSCPTSPIPRYRRISNPTRGPFQSCSRFRQPGATCSKSFPRLPTAGQLFRVAWVRARQCGQLSQVRRDAAHASPRRGG
jgi:hypothetical protein